MRVLPISIVLLSVAAVAIISGRSAAEALQNLENGKNGVGGAIRSLDAHEEGAQLKMSIRVTAPESAHSLRLHVTFENLSDEDTVLNLGMMLANGRTQLPDAVRLILTDSGGRPRELHFSDRRYPGIAGRVDDYAVPLRTGSAYTLKLSLEDYWCPKSKDSALDLKPGRYSVRAEFTGKSAQHLNGDVEGLKFLPFWTGKLRSEAATFRIGKQG